ncbi:hypothetical protein E3G45_004988 [Mycobacteroides abscessus]|nr:hypothetical protein [Mycobacteroides abscessus]
MWVSQSGMARIEVSPEDAETIAKSCWYLGTTEKGEFFGFWQPFTRLRSVGEVHFSRNFQGFRLYQQPRGITDEPYARGFFPWTVWRVTPIDVIRTWRLPHRIHARRIQIEELLPAGAEFGPHGDRIYSFADHLAQLDPWPKLAARSAYLATEERNALIDLAQATPSPFIGDLWSETRFALSFVRRRVFKAKRNGINDQQLREQLSLFKDELSALVRAFITGTPIPEVLTVRWSMPSDLAPATTNTA